MKKKITTIKYVPVKATSMPAVKKAGTKKKQKKKVVLTTIAVGAAGVLGYFGWQYMKKQKEKKFSDPVSPKSIPSTPYEFPAADSIPRSTPRPTPGYTPKVKPPKSKASSGEGDPGGFPLRRGSKGDKVRALQEALIAKNGKAIMPRYGADGQFGAEMAAALKKLKLPASIDQTTYNVLVQGHVADKSTTALKLYNAAVAADYRTALSLLKTMKSKEDYQSIGAQFKNYRINGVRQTLVNGMLNSFTTEEQKQAIRFEFIRMGLQYDGNKWSLSGLGGLPIMTNQDTTVWLNARSGIKVSGKTVLGNEISKRLDYTLFENNGKYFLVRTSATNYL